MEKLFEVALVFSGHEWIEAFHRHCTNTGVLKIKSLVYDTSALEAEDFDACIIADSHPCLNKAFISQIKDNNQLVFAVAPPQHQVNNFLADLNVDAIFNSSLTPRELASEIKDFLSQVTTKPEFDLDPIKTYLQEETPPAQLGQIIGVIGHGGTGSSFIATELAKRLVDSVLVDLDFDHPSLALNLQADIEPNLLDAIESSKNQEDIIQVTNKQKEFGFIAGLSHPSFSYQISTNEINVLLKDLSSTYSNSVLDLGRVCETSKNIEKIDSIISHCDTLIVTFEPTPLGVLRLLELCAHIQSLQSQQNIIAVANRFPSQSAIERSIRQEVGTIDVLSNIFFVPDVSEQLLNNWKNKKKLPKAFKKSIDEMLQSISDPLRDARSEKPAATLSGHIDAKVKEIA